jgi:hypothetical protein
MSEEYHIPAAPVSAGQTRSQFFASVGEAIGVKQREGGAATYAGIGVVFLTLTLVGWFIWKRRK